MSNCRSSCPTPGAHKTFGECARAGRLMVGWSREAYGLDKSADNRLQGELKDFRECVEAGILPDGTTRAKIDFARRQSDIHGGLYGEEFRVIPKESRKGYDAVFRKEEKKLMDELKANDHEVIRQTAQKTGIDI